MITTGRTLSPRPLTRAEKRAVIAMQAHLRCEDLLSGKASPGRMDRRTAEGLKIYQRLHMLADNSKIDPDTRTVLLGDSREHDFRLLLRVLRERVVDATGLLEDGSALGVAGPGAGARARQPRVPAAGRAGGQGAGRPPRPRPRRRPRRRRNRPRRTAAAAADAVGQDHRRAGSDRRGHPRGQPGAGLDVTGGRAREHAGSACAARRNEEARAQDGGEEGTGAAAHGRRDQAAAAAAVPRPQDGAARGDRSRRRGPGAAAARQGRTEEVEAPGRRPPDADAVRAQAGDKRGGPQPLADHHRRLEDDREEGRHHGAQVQGVRHGRRPVARGAGHPELAPGAGHAHPQAARQASATRFEPKTEIIGPGYRAAYGLVAIVAPPDHGAEREGRTAAHGPPHPDARHARLPIGQARREQRLPPAAQLPGPAAVGLPREAPRARARRHRARGLRAEPRTTRARRWPSRARARATASS